MGARYLASFGVALVLQLHALPSADACGVKLIAKSPSPGRNARRPVRTDKPTAVVTAGPVRKPIAAGPPPDRTVVAVKEPEPEPKPPAPEPPPAVATVKPDPVRDPQPTAKPPRAVAAIRHEEVYFNVNSAIPSNKASITRVAMWLASDSSAQVVVDGHADPTGTPEKNMTLSRTRAEAVRDQLVAAGVDASRIEVRAFGDTQIKYKRTDGRNRRVSIEPKP